MKKLLIGLLALASLSVFAQNESQDIVYTVQAGDKIVLLRSVDAKLDRKIALEDLKNRCDEISGTLLAKPKCETFHTGACYQVCKF